jgi:hypothetical protein
MLCWYDAFVNAIKQKANSLIGLNFALPICCLLTLCRKESYLFWNTSLHTKQQDPTMSGSSVVLSSQFRTVSMLTLLAIKLESTKVCRKLYCHTILPTSNKNPSIGQKPVIGRDIRMLQSLYKENIQIVFWGATWYSVKGEYHRFGVTCYFHCRSVLLAYFMFIAPSKSAPFRFSGSECPLSTQPACIT